MTSAPIGGESSAPMDASQRVPLFGPLFVVAVLGMAAAYVRAIFFTPIEALQGAAQKIYYIHVPSALSAYLALTIVALMSIVYLWLGDERADRLAESAGEVGLLFLTGVLTTGPLWAKPIWGTWWTWDARLTLTLFLWFLTAGYLVLRGAIEDRAMRARYSAVLGILAAVLIPFIHLSVYLFNTLHPMPILLKPAKPSMPNEMVVTFLGFFAACAVLCIALIRARYRYGLERDALQAIESGGEEGD
ncbi:MAG TPA: cytochrome c biogenesis protein CcsA [Gemmatimonadaceae bacterium]